MDFMNDLSEFKLNISRLGYELVQFLSLNEINSVFYKLKHSKTGAEHIHIGNDDKENAFGVILKTIPIDSTGVAHVLEHTVLCGSLKFPVKDPFFSMLKRSLSTFMNAFTASDWTMYPFSTQNRKDYYNLLEVYIDSVYFPKLEEISFKQEGFRIDFEDPIMQKELAYRGIVYNEMKGAMSSPNQVMIQSVSKALYPNTTYKNNSGGDPVQIPSLTYEKLKDFHKKYYHPSNSFFYTYGNLPLYDHLNFINEKILRFFSFTNSNLEVKSQPRWKKPKSVLYSYPLSRTENRERKYQICVAWLTSDIKDSFEVLVLSILEQVLLGNAASPLRKILTDSKIGTTLCDGTGFHSENKDTMFVCGLKDVRKNDSKKIEKIIFEELKKLSENGIDKKSVESVLHQIEFSRKEKTNKPYPFGIRLLLGISSCWLHGGDPGNVLKLDEDLEKLNECMLNEQFFEESIRHYFIDNNHRVLLVLEPDYDMEKNEIERVKKELLKIRRSMNNIDVEKVVYEMVRLDELRAKEEDLSCLPSLQIEDISDQVEKISSEISISEKINIRGYIQPTSGIVYFCELLGVGLLEEEMLSWVPFLCYIFPRLGTSEHNYIKMAQKIDLCTGGVSLNFHPRIKYNSGGKCLPFLSLDSKCFIRNSDKMLDIIQEMITKINFNDHERIYQLFREYKAGIESMIISNAHVLAISLASRNFTASSYLNEVWTGVTQVRMIKKFFKEIEKEKIIKLAGKLKYIFETVFLKNGSRLALIGEKQALDVTVKNVEKYSEIFMIGDKNKFNYAKFDLADKNINNGDLYEGWVTSTAVSFVAQTFETVRMEHEDSQALLVLSKIIRSMYLHKEIREKGGAYGAFSLYDSERGLFSLCSYRDPNIVNTLKVYDRMKDFILANKIGEEDVKEAILQVCAEIDKPDSPPTASKKDFVRKMVMISDDVRQEYKAKLLNLKKKDIMMVADKYLCQNKIGKSTAIISNEDLLDRACDKLNRLNLKLNLI